MPIPIRLPQPLDLKYAPENVRSAEYLQDGQEPPLRHQRPPAEDLLHLVASPALQALPARPLRPLPPFEGLTRPLEAPRKALLSKNRLLNSQGQLGPLPREEPAVSEGAAADDRVAEAAVSEGAAEVQVLEGRGASRGGGAE